MNIAVVGCGQIADAHFQEINRIDGAQVIAVCDLNIHLAKQAALRFNISKWYTDINLMMEENELDVVHVTTPPLSHYSIAKTLLDYDVNIYMEKPFTINLHEAKELVEIAAKKSRLICAGHNSAFDPAFLEFQEIYKRGDLGEVAHINCGMGYSLKGPFGKIMMGDPNHWVHKLPGGIPQNNISHPVSLILSIMKDPEINIYTRGFKWRSEKNFME